MPAVKILWHHELNGHKTTETEYTDASVTFTNGYPTQAALLAALPAARGGHAQVIESYHNS